ncbi:MAG: hypothetical protein EXR78_09660 [Deltaproteobacteria bacterium]|nr:hypothetical protein [Deltaproteobacteria bacterium]
MTQFRFVEHIPDLIHPEEYPSDPQGRRVRLRIRHTDQGIEIIGDAIRPDELENLLTRLDVDTIEQMLCG